MGEGARRNARSPGWHGAARASLAVACALALPSVEGEAAAGPRRAAVVAMGPTFEIQADGSSRFTVPLSASVTVEETKSATSIVYTMKGVRVPKRNDRNPLVTVFWNTPVEHARLQVDRTGAKFVLRLRAAATPASRLLAGEDGRYLLEIVFARGDYLPASAIAGGAPSAAPEDSSSPRP